MEVTNRAPLGDESSINKHTCHQYLMLHQTKAVSDLLDGRVRVERSDKNLDLRIDPGLFLGRGSNDTESTSSFTVKTHVLGKRLRQDRLVSLGNKVSEGKGIVINVSGSESLVSHVKEGEVSLFLAQVGELLPLLMSRVDSSRVVSTSVQENDRVVGSVPQVLLHALKVQTDGFLVKVLVLLDLETRVLGNGNVVAPCRPRQVDGLCMRVEPGQKGHTDPQCTSSRDGLGGSDSLFLDRCAILAICQLDRELGKVCQTSNGKVLLVCQCLVQSLFGLNDRGQNVWLAVSITLCISTKRNEETRANQSCCTACI